MNPSKVAREAVKNLTDLPNIGRAGAEDLQLIGINRPSDLIGLDPYEMYENLCKLTGSRHDPCVIDVFISVTDFMNGGDPQPWWKYTSERKRELSVKKGCRD